MPTNVVNKTCNKRITGSAAHGNMKVEKNVKSKVQSYETTVTNPHSYIEDGMPPCTICALNDLHHKIVNTICTDKNLFTSSSFFIKRRYTTIRWR